MARNFIQYSEDYLRQIDAEIGHLQALRTQVSLAIQKEGTSQTSPRSSISAIGRERIAKAQKARWARKRAANRKAAVSVPEKSVKKVQAKKSTASKPSA